MIYKNFQKTKKQSKVTQAAVIRYDNENKTPTVVAQGRGEIAQKIIEQAKKHDIPMQEDTLLLENLLQLDLGHDVPPQLYQVVAEVLLLVRRANTGDTNSQFASSPPLLQQTPYWEEEDENQQEISIDDLLDKIREM